MTNIKDENLDKECLDIVDSNINMSVPWYLMAAYAYYVEDDPILSDSRFDRLSRTMIEKWDQIEHMHKDHISMDDLQAGTYLGEYPSNVKYAVESVRKIGNEKPKR